MIHSDASVAPVSCRLQQRLVAAAAEEEGWAEGPEC